MKIGIVNNELDDFSICKNKSLVTVVPNEYECDWNLISCRFINALNDSIAHQVYYDNYEDAYNDAKHGRLIGVIVFKHNFTDSYMDVNENGRDAEDGSLENKNIDVFLDKTDQQITFFMERKLRDTYKEFTQDLMTECNWPKRLGNIPVNFEDPVYGTMDQEFTNFVAPGVVMT